MVKHDPNSHVFRLPSLFDPRFKKFIGKRCIYCNVSEDHAVSDWCTVAARRERARKAARAAIADGLRKAMLPR